MESCTSVLVRTPSSFLPARRPIYIYPIADVTKKNAQVAYPAIAEAVTTILIRHPNSRILVHTVSFELASFLVKSISAPQSLRLISYAKSSDRQRAIDRYMASCNGVLIAASLERGIDLPGDSCRAIVVCKVPFPNLADKQISARLHSPGGQLWYSVKTVRSIVQMTGRGMRSEDDFCESYILDRQFVTNIWRRCKTLLPTWWTEALVWDKGTLK